MPEYAPRIQMISRSEHRKISIDCQGNLEGDSVITGAPLVTEVGSSHLTVDGIEVSSSTLVINDQSVPAGKAITFWVDARGASVKRNFAYPITVEFDTDAGERIAGGIRLKTD